MTNTELTKIREDRKLSKKEFTDLLGVTAMMNGRYEKGTCAIPESIAEKLKEAEDKAAFPLKACAGLPVIRTLRSNTWTVTGRNRK